jgi:oxygen-dependent protoporphyrinogen oxidase
MEPTHDVIVAGAGVGGLTLALTLARRGRRVALVERADRVGGVVRSEIVDDFLLETGPNSFTSGPEVDGLLESLGLAARAQRRPLRTTDRFVFWGGRLRRVPTGPLQLLRSDALPRGAGVRALAGLVMPVPEIRGDISVGEFFRGVLGPQAVERLVKPFVAGIYAGDADALSLAAAFPTLHRAALGRPLFLRAAMKMRRPRPAGTPRTPKALVSFPRGLAELPARLAERLAEARGTVYTSWQGAIQRTATGWRATVPGGADLVAPRLVLATPADQAAELLADVDPALAAGLAAIPYARLTVVHVGVRESECGERRGGFGFLNAQSPADPPTERDIRMLGMIWSDRIFPGRAPDGYRLCTCFYGGTKDPAANDLDDDTLERQTHADMVAAMGLWPTATFRLFRVTRWDRALPAFPVGSAAATAALVSGAPAGLDFLGNWRGDVAVPGRIAAAIRLAESL